MLAALLGVGGTVPPIPACLQFNSLKIAVLTGGALFTVLCPLLRVPTEMLFLGLGAMLALLAGCSSFWAP